jgi:methylglutaconyl-CoA hydratase
MKRPSGTEDAAGAGTAALRGYFASLARYHAWATAQLYEHVDRLPDADYRKDAGLFFKSVRGTLNHLLVADALWFPRFADGVSNKVALDAELERDRAALRDRLLAAVPRWQPLIASFDDARFTEASTLDYTTAKGIPVAAVRADARPRLQPWHAPPRPDHRRDHRDGLPLPRDRLGVDAAGREPGTNDIMTTTLRIERDGPVARVWLDRPEVRNAMNGTLIRELAAAFAALAGAEGVRAIVLGGSGKAFCAGADLAFMREAAEFTWEQNHADAAALAEMLWAMYSCPVPVIARIHGDCYAGGLGLASVCDIRVVADAVTFSLSEARLGLLPATISPYVIRAMGEQAARRYFISAERFGAAEAKAMGFAHEVCGAAAIDEVVGRFTAAIVANGPMATRACKQLVRDVAGREISAELRADTARRIADIRASAEGREGIQSFLDKRAPAWLLPVQQEESKKT